MYNFQVSVIGDKKTNFYKSDKNKGSNLRFDNSRSYLESLDEYEIIPYNFGSAFPHDYVEIMNASQVLSYDLNLKTVSKTNNKKNIDDDNLIQSILSEGYTPENVILPDGRVKITNTTDYPWSSICKLLITAGDGALYIASGFIVGSPDGHGYHVLTAGHCAYIHENGGWVQSIVVIPAYNDGYAPFWVAYAVNLRVYSGWTDFQLPEYDIALITLDRNIGDYTGWMGISTFDAANPVYSGELNTAGYPGDLDQGECMYWSSEVGAGATENLHYYYLDTYGGQSGSPVWYQDVNPTVLSVHAYGSNGLDPNFGTRINDEKYDDLAQWLSDDTSPTDYANLVDDGEAYAGFTPIVIDNNETVFTVWSSESNLGTASSGNYNVSYYASWDSTITSSDFLIGTVFVGNVGPFSYHETIWSGILPENIQSGLYYVGWIIDSENNVPELRDDGENDNTGIITSQKLNVDYPIIISEIIVDDVDAVLVGSWPTASSVSGYYGTGYKYRWAGTGSNTATWPIDIPTAGNWEVFARWTSGSNRATDAPYTINYAGSSRTVDVNQRVNGGQWISLGVYSFNVGLFSVVLSDNANDVVIADAIRLVSSDIQPPVYYDVSLGSVENTSSTNNLGSIIFDGTSYSLPDEVSEEEATYLIEYQPIEGYQFTEWQTTGDVTIINQFNRVTSVTISGEGTVTAVYEVDSTPPATEIIVDDVDAEYIGSWPSSSTVSGYYGTGYRYRWAGSGENRVKWTLNIPFEDEWEILALWTSGSNRATNVDYYFEDPYESNIIESSPEATHIIVNQQENGGEWYSLGKFDLRAQYYTIRTTDLANGVVIADAIKVVSTGGVNPPVTYDISLESVENTTSTSNLGSTLFDDTLYNLPDTLSEQAATYPIEYQPAEGYKFTEWQSSGGATVLNSNSESTTVTVSGDGAISAVYEVSPSLPAPTEIIIDDVDAVLVGSWPIASTVSGYYGTGYKYRWAGSGANTATWTINIPTSGTWEVYARWTSGSNRATDAPYTIYHADGSTTVDKNQEVNNGQWVSLGTYDFDVGAYSVRLSDNANGVVIADAIRMVTSDVLPLEYYDISLSSVENGNSTSNLGSITFDGVSYSLPVDLSKQASTYTIEYEPADGYTLIGWQNTGSISLFDTISNPPLVTITGDATIKAIYEISGPPPPVPEFILDDTDADFVGSWPTSTITSGYYGSGYRYRWAGSGSNTATWSFEIPERGVWAVYARWTSGGNRATDATYIICDANGDHPFEVNQQQDGGEWVAMGVWDFFEDTYEISLSDDANGVVIADAIWLEKVWWESD